MPRDALQTRFSLPDPRTHHSWTTGSWTTIADLRSQCGHVLYTVIPRQPAPTRAAAAWMVARLVVALFLLAAAGRVGHGGLLNYISGQ